MNHALCSTTFNAIPQVNHPDVVWQKRPCEPCEPYVCVFVWLHWSGFAMYNNGVQAYCQVHIHVCPDNITSAQFSFQCSDGCCPYKLTRLCIYSPHRIVTSRMLQVCTVHRQPSTVDRRVCGLWTFSFISPLFSGPFATDAECWMRNEPHLCYTPPEYCARVYFSANSQRWWRIEGTTICVKYLSLFHCVCYQSTCYPEHVTATILIGAILPEAHI